MRLLLALTGVLAAAPPPASESPVPALEWRAPPGCPAEPELRAQVAALLAGIPAGAARDITIRLRVTPLPTGRWRLDATLRGPAGNGQRSLEAARCDALVEAAALLIAIAVDPTLAAEPADRDALVPAAPPTNATSPVPATSPTAPLANAPANAASSSPATSPTPRAPANAPPSVPAAPPAHAPASAASSSPATSPTPRVPANAASSVPAVPPAHAPANATPSVPAASPAPNPDAAPASSHDSSDMFQKTSPPRPPARSLQFPLTFAVGPGLGAISRTAAVVRLAVGVRRRNLGVVLGQSVWLPRDLPAPGDPGVGGRVWLWSTGLRACAHPGRGRLELPLCAGVEAGVLTGKGIGALIGARRVTSAWAAASLGPGALVRLTPRVAFTLGLDLLIILAYPRLQIPGRGTVCCAARLGALATAGLELRLGAVRRSGQRF